MRHESVLLREKSRTKAAALYVQSLQVNNRRDSLEVPCVPEDVVPEGENLSEILFGTLGSMSIKTAVSR